MFKNISNYLFIKNRMNKYRKQQIKTHKSIKDEFLEEITLDKIEKFVLYSGFTGLYKQIYHQ